MTFDPNTTPAPTYGSPDYSISEEHKAMLDKMVAEEKARKEAAAMEAERKAKLENLMKDEQFSYLYNNGLKEMLDKSPGIIDATGTLEASITVVTEKLALKNQTSTQPQNQQQTQGIKPPLMQTATQSDSTTEQEGRLLNTMTYKEMVDAGVDKTTAMMARAFPPRKEIRIK